MSRIFLAVCDDAARLREQIIALVATEEATLETDLSAFPEPWEEALALVVLSPRSLSDPNIATFVREAGDRNLPLIPVVADLGQYASSAVSLPELKRLNTVGFQPGNGQALLQAIREHLGRSAFPRLRKVFLSYRRQDGDAVAQRLYHYLRRNGFDPFLDVFQIEGGAPVQERIFEAIADKDFVLLIDSPRARESAWIRAEIVEALNQRIPVRTLAVDLHDPYPLLPDVERLAWNPGDRHMLSNVRSFISRAIGVTASFDQRCRRLLSGAAAIRGLRIEEIGRRRVRLSGRGRRTLVEYERALPSLERLHRLYKSYRTEARTAAILVSGDQPIPEPTLEAIDWARGRAALRVVALHDLLSVLDLVFP